MPRGRAQLYPATESIPTSFTPEIRRSRVTPDSSVLQSDCSCFVNAIYLFLPYQGQKRSFLEVLINFYLKDLSHYDDLLTESAQMLKMQDAQKCDFERIITRKKWRILLDVWMFREASYFHRTPVWSGPWKSAWPQLRLIYWLASCFKPLDKKLSVFPTTIT